LELLIDHHRQASQAVNRDLSLNFEFMRRTVAVGILLWVWAILPASATDSRILHAINRLSFGPRPGDVERVQSIGVQQYIQEQLYPERLSLPTSLTTKLDRLASLRLNTTQLAAAYGQTAKASPTDRQHQRRQSKSILDEAVQARLLRSLESPRQLEEVMVDFWYNHFNVAASKGINRVWVGNYEQQAIRPHTLGKFRDLLSATAKHPAMLNYLDNWQNTAPNSPGARGQFRGLNENYARELMELHTLGAQGGYTQKDVTSLAKILTGWGYRRLNQKKGGEPFTFFFDPQRHDFSTKNFLGKTIASSGEQEVQQALELLAKNPATAKFVSYKLAQYFVNDKPSNSLVDRMQKRWLQTDGDIRSVLTTLFNSPEFWATSAYQAKFKTPYQYVVSAVRVTGWDVQNIKPIVNQLQQLGMPLYNCATPDGYKNTRSAWLNENAMIQRLNFATSLGNGRSLLNIEENIQPMTLDSLDTDRLNLTISPFISLATQKKIASSNPRLRASLLLGSPDFMYH
jgi:uncharacterized protein (DUF1800 family)